jgi:MtN3 and saliva related transmembrane protein
MEAQELLGYAAGMLTTVAVIPQITKAWKTRAVDDISLLTVVTLICGLGLWAAYGVMTQSWPLILTNGISFALYCFLFGLVVHEKQRRKWMRP